MRIARVLRESKPKTVGLLGSYGSGKTSLLKMVEYYLEHPEDSSAQPHKDHCRGRIIACSISGWGIHEDKATELILKEAITSLAEETDTLSIAYLPQRYRAAISGSGSIPERFLSAVLGDGGNPQACLRRLDRLLCRLDLRMVIFLEDIDRNKDKNCLAEIGTLLDGLKGLDCLTFVLAMGDPSDSDSILRRVCEHIDAVPRPDRQSLLNLIEEFRRHCLSDVDQRVRCVPDQDMDERLGIQRSYRTQIMDQVGNAEKMAVDYLMDLLANPRALKTVLRRTCHAWGSLKGEINLDDLLVAKAIQIEAPEVFDFINTYISRIFWLQVELGVASHDKPDPVTRQWKALKEKRKRSREIEVLQKDPWIVR